MIRDESGRTFKNLRISLLNNCNFACVYCVEEDVPIKNEKSEISLSQLIEMTEKLHLELNLDAVRLTGGEPLLYPHLEELISSLHKIGIPKIKMTSNGFLLNKKVKALRDAGLKEINISLDAAEEASFFRMTKRDKFQEVSEGIDAALEAGVSMKINSVLMKGRNDDQVLPLLAYAGKRGITIRFLEVMAMGHLHHQLDESLFSQKDILALIAAKYNFRPLERNPSATANYWITDNGLTFGIIANTSEPFCQDCNRLRLDQNGNIYGCLSVNDGISIKNSASKEDLRESLMKALKQKQTLSFKGSELSMLQIGG